MKAILKYPGAKNRIAEWICEYIPSHSVYLEPFAGSLAVFFTKEQARIETLNDLDGEVVNYFRVIRNHPDELAEALKLTPFARDEYYAAYDDDTGISDVERARRFAVRCWQGFGCSNAYKNGFRSSQQSASPHTTKEWREIPYRLRWAHDRLLNAQIENLPAEEIIRRYDTEDVFMYVDPPYLPDIRKPHIYKHEMSEDDHIRLLDMLVHHPGRVIISGYDNPLYNDFLKGWEKRSRKSQAECGIARTETIWMNYRLSGGGK